MKFLITDKKEQLKFILKGYAMGMADIVPGVSGGTVAFITGIYQTLLKSIASVDHNFFKLLLKLKIKDALLHINAPFLVPLFIGILTALITMAKVMHYLMHSYPIYTWSLFFGLILASILFVGKNIENIKSPKSLVSILGGTLIGYAIVSLIPVTTPNTLPYVFGAAIISICAMILPGISGSFLLLILGKYAFITGMLKNPTAEGALEVMLVFAAGALVGLISFSKVLNWVLDRYHNITMAFLTGFMIGSLKKVWPWKETLDSVVIRGKTHVLKEANIFPNFSLETTLGLGIMIFGAMAVIIIESKSQRRVSSAG